MSDDEIAAELKGLRHTGGYLDAGSTGAAEALRFIADRVRTLLDEQDDRVPDEPPGEEMGKILTAFAGTVVTISIQCACCNERLITRGVAGEMLDAELEHFRQTERWLRLPRREANPLRPHPVNVCQSCRGEISARPSERAPCDVCSALNSCEHTREP